MPSHLPALRRGRPYESLEKSSVTDYRTGAVLATVSQVNAGIIRKDLAKFSESRAALKKFSTGQLMEICAAPGNNFSTALSRWAARSKPSRRRNTSRRFPPQAVCPRSWCAATWRKFTARLST